MSEEEYEIIASPITDWLCVKLDPRVHDTSMFGLEVPQDPLNKYAWVRCFPHCGNWLMQISWEDGAYTVGNHGSTHKVSLVRDLSMIRARRNQLLEAKRFDEAAAFDKYLKG